ncbi:MAG: co-chaperone GroES [Planctomycetes bacterium]|nr:co-chaperone GroES [Planctomycetota bacterium]NUQ34932.1 co-chaperone GroES [Planctomycetaceae bacterium]
MSKIRPLGDHILVERLEAEDVTAGGIVLPDTAKEKPAEGTVIALGQGRALENGKRAPFTVKEKDRVLFSSYSGSTVKYNGKEYLIMREDDVLAVLA